jgi:predicted transcriptional regulator
LEKAVRKVRELSAEDQDTVAVAVLSMTEETPVALDDEARAAIREGLEQARRGGFVPDGEITARRGSRQGKDLTLPDRTACEQASQRIGTWMR